MPALDPVSLVEHHGFVRALAYGVLGRDDLADDAAQDAYVTALARGAPEPRRLPAFLAVLVRRRAVDVARRASARARHEHAGRRPTASARSVDDVLARAELGKAMAEAVLALASPYREAILLRYYEALPPRDLAARLGIPVDTARTHVRRGLERLRAALDADHRGRERWMPAAVALLGEGVELETSAAPWVAIVATAAVCAAAGVGAASLRGGAPADPPPARVAHAEGDSGAGPALAGARGPSADAPTRADGGAVVGASSVAGPTFAVWVVDEDGPVAGARVSVEVTGGPAASGTTTADGIARIRLPHAGRLEVRVEAAGRAAFARSHVRSERGAADPWRIELVRGATLRGRVVDERTGGRIAGATVVAYGDARAELRADETGDDGGDVERSAAVAHVTTRTASDGTFVLDGVIPRGWTQVAAVADGYARTGLDVRMPDPAAPVELALAPGGGLDVVVSDARGRPVPCARVTARVEGVEGPISFATLSGPGSAPSPAEREGSEEAWAHAPLTTVTDADGRAAVAGVPLDRPVALRVTHPSFPPSEVAALEPLTHDGPRRRVSVVLRVGTSLRIVPLGPDGQPIAIQLHRRAYFPEALTPDDGRHVGPVTLRRLGAGRHALRLFARGMAPHVLEVELEEGVPVEREVRFESGAAVEGRLVDERGAPLAGRTVVAWSHARETWSQRGVSAADGTFRVTGVEAGLVRLAVEDPTSSGPPPIDVTAPARDVVVRRRRKALVGFRLERDAGTAAPETVVREVRPARGRAEALAFDGDDFRDVVYDGGPATLELRAEGFATVRKVIDVAPGERLDLGIVRLTRGATLDGVVVDGDGRPVVAAEVLRGPPAGATHDGLQAPAVTDAEGRFTVGQIPSHGATLFVAADGYGEQAVEVEATASAPLRVVLARGGELHVSVGAAEGAGAVVEWVELAPTSGAPRTRRCMADEQGRLDACLVPGRYVVRWLDDDGAVRATEEAEIVAGRRSNVGFAPR